MHIGLTFILLTVSLILLVKGSDVFVSASTGIARNFKVSQLFIGLTIMAFGTSAPEAVIGIQAATSGTSILAMGNIIGSNIFNLIFIIGFAAVITPIKIKFKDIAKDYAMAILGPVLLLLMMVYFDVTIPRVGGILFLILFGIYLFQIIKQTLRNREALAYTESYELTRPLKYHLLWAVLGIGAIIIGGELTVHFAQEMAISLGLSTRLVGLSIIAIGTSLPELFIVIMAAKQNVPELAIGNIIGSSIFNVLFVLGLTGTIAPLPVDGILMVDLLFLLFGSLLLLIFIVIRKKITRVQGVVLMGFYLIYLIFMMSGAL